MTFPVVLQRMPLIDEGTSAYKNRHLVLRQLEADLWCVCYYLVNEDMYVSGTYFDSYTEAQTFFNEHVAKFIQRYQDTINDLRTQVDYWNSHYVLE